MKLKKGKQVFEVGNEIQAAAFKAAGWVEVKPKGGKKAEDAEPPADQAAEEAAEEAAE